MCNCFHRTLHRRWAASASRPSATCKWRGRWLDAFGEETTKKVKIYWTKLLFFTIEIYWNLLKTIEHIPTVRKVQLLDLHGKPRQVHQCSIALYKITPQCLEGAAQAMLALLQRSQFHSSQPWKTKPLEFPLHCCWSPISPDVVLRPTPFRCSCSAKIAGPSYVMSSPPRFTAPLQHPFGVFQAIIFPSISTLQNKNLKSKKSE